MTSENQPVATDYDERAVRAIGTDLAQTFARTRRALRLNVRTVIPWEHLSVVQVELLQTIQEDPGIRLGVLASRRRMATNTVSMTIQQMVVNGLVERNPSPTDRRAVELTLTVEGEAVLDRWLDANRGAITEALSHLDAAERDRIADALEALQQLATHLEHQ